MQCSYSSYSRYYSYSSNSSNSSNCCYFCFSCNSCYSPTSGGPTTASLLAAGLESMRLLKVEDTLGVVAYPATEAPAAGGQGVEGEVLQDGVQGDGGQEEEPCHAVHLLVALLPL